MEDGSTKSKSINENSIDDSKVKRAANLNGWPIPLGKIQINILVTDVEKYEYSSIIQNN